MKLVISVLFMLLICSCAVTSNRYYLPVDPLLAKEGTVCGFVPWGRAHIPIAEGITAGIDLAPANDLLSATIQLSIPTGVTIRFTNPEIQFFNPSISRVYIAPLERWQVGVYGRSGRPGYHDYFAPDALLEGLGRNTDLTSTDTSYLEKDLFISVATVQAPANDEIVMTLPPIEVNGVSVPSKDILLRLVEKTGVMTCVQ